ncbi:MAG: hypothetical protein R2911_21225 [Caldilineaceae bacterium]
MEILLPTNDDDRLALLRRFVEMANQDAENGRFLLSTRSQERMAEFTQRFASALWSVREKKERQTQYIREADEMLMALGNAIQDIWNQVRWQVEWGELNSHAVEYYGLTRRGRQPKIKSRSGWIAVGDKILSGDEMAKKQGYPGVERIAEFTRIYNQAKDALDRLGETKVAVSAATAQLAKLRRESERYGRRAIAELRLALSDESATRRRDIMRTYGVRFGSSAADVGFTQTGVEPVANGNENPRTGVAMSPRQTPWAEPVVTSNLYAANGVKPAINGHGATLS